MVTRAGDIPGKHVSLQQIFRFARARADLFSLKHVSLEVGKPRARCIVGGFPNPAANQRATYRSFGVMSSLNGPWDVFGFKRFVARWAFFANMYPLGFQNRARALDRLRFSEPYRNSARVRAKKKR